MDERAAVDRGSVMKIVILVATVYTVIVEWK